MESPAFCLPSKDGHEELTRLRLVESQVEVHLDERCLRELFGSPRLRDRDPTWRALQSVSCFVGDKKNGKKNGWREKTRKNSS